MNIIFRHDRARLARRLLEFGESIAPSVERRDHFRAGPAENGHRRRRLGRPVGEPAECFRERVELLWDRQVDEVLRLDADRLQGRLRRIAGALRFAQAQLHALERLRHLVEIGAGDFRHRADLLRFVGRRAELRAQPLDMLGSLLGRSDPFGDFSTAKAAAKVSAAEENASCTHKGRSSIPAAPSRLWRGRLWRDRPTQI